LFPNNSKTAQKNQLTPPTEQMINPKGSHDLVTGFWIDEAISQESYSVLLLSGAEALHHQI